jgi:hypothetical protein
MDIQFKRRIGGFQLNLNDFLHSTEDFYSPDGFILNTNIIICFKNDKEMLKLIKCFKD